MTPPRVRRLQALDRPIGAHQRVTERNQAVRLDIACGRLGISKRTGERLLAQGLFPIPALPRITRKRGSPHLFSTIDIDRYLAEASTADALVGASR